ncbi:MAG: ATP-binding protein [Peptococcaceae bacterium]|nr:ATP-binding protein [Peptococcaceae bacterium]
MTLRSKFITALVGMLVLLSIIYGSISLLAVKSLLDRSVSYIQQGYVSQWNRDLVDYYTQHGNWDGIEAYLLQTTRDPRLPDFPMPRDSARIIVLDKSDNIVASLDTRDLGKKLGQLPDGASIKTKLLPINVNNKVTGYFWLGDSPVNHQPYLFKKLASSIVSSMELALIITSLVAVFLGILLTRKLTAPLRKLSNAVANVAAGKLSTRITLEGSKDVVLLGEAFNHMTKQLTRNEEVRSNMVADIAHELRTPLTVISGKLESIQEGVIDNSLETLLPIQDEVIRMSRLVRDLQQLSLAEAGKLPIVAKEVQLDTLIGNIVDHFAVAFEEKSIKVDIVGQAIPVEGDQDRLTQVFVNLIDNAIRHTAQGGEISVHFKTGTNTAENETFGIPGLYVLISDSGEGIKEEDLDKIFNRFYRVDHARVRESGGTGLGLAIAKEFILAHGGKISATSQIGVGTQFTVWIPEKYQAQGRKV